jgi:uncharacterized Ntn-hydrolase superfamily protein
MKSLLILVVLLSGAVPLNAQTRPPGPLAHTYSIVARDTVTGEMGVAVQSHWFSVGSIVSWAEAGVGAIATQSFVNVSFGPRSLALLRAGHCSDEVVRMLIDADSGRDVRQLAVVDTHGHVAAWTGSMCIPDAGHYSGHGFSVQANLMLNDRVWPAMASAFEKTIAPLAERMIAALEAGQAVGGDIRGQQSAAILVVRARASDKPWEDRLIDLRVEDHPNPVEELKRLLRVHRAYELMNRGDLAIEHGDEHAALELYSGAEKLDPDQVEMKYWHAVSLVNVGRLDESLPLFQNVFAADPNWRTLTARLPAVRLLNVTREQLDRILKLR